MSLIKITIVLAAVLIECCCAMGSRQNSIPKNIIAKLQKLSQYPRLRLNHLLNSPDSRVAESMQRVLADIDSMNISLQDLKSTLALAVAVTWRMADDAAKPRHQPPLRLNHPIRTNFTTAVAATQVTSMEHGRRRRRRRAAGMTLTTQQQQQQQQPSTASAAAADPQAHALRCIYNSTAGDMWRNRRGWSSNSSICSWWGVKCLNHLVFELHLGANNLRGSIAPCFAALTMLQQL